MQWPNEEVEKLRDKQVSIMREKLVGESTIEVSGIPASQVNWCSIFLHSFFYELYNLGQHL